METKGDVVRRASLHTFFWPKKQKRDLFHFAWFGLKWPSPQQGEQRCQELGGIPVKYNFWGGLSLYTMEGSGMLWMASPGAVYGGGWPIIPGSADSFHGQKSLKAPHQS